MLQIRINGQEAVLKTGTQIKFTRENPFFSEAGDYTLDVTFPLAGCAQNQRIFGAVHRPEMSRKALLKKSYTFALSAGTLSLAGRAAVTAVTQEEIKLQLLAGKSAFNFDSIEGESGEERYVDELDLGRMTQRIWDKVNAWIQTHWDEYYAHAADNGLTGANNTLAASLCSKIFTAAERSRLMHGSSDDTDCVFFPIYSTEDEAWSNPHDFRYWGEDEYMGDNASPRRKWRMDAQTYFFPLYAGQAFPLPGTATPGEYLFQKISARDGEWVADDFAIAPQPYLCFVVERIFAALGYELPPERNVLRQGAFKNVFLANARSTERLADILPHWTVREFFEQLQKFLGVMVIVDGTQVTIESRNAVYANAAAIALQDVTDEQSTDLDEEGDAKDPTAGNVGYDFPDTHSAYIALGADRYEQVEVRRFATLAECQADMQAEEWNTKQYGNLLYIDESTGNRYYVHFNMTLGSDLSWTTGYELRPLDLMGPLFRTKQHKVDTALKFVPCRISDLKPTWRIRMDWGTRIEKYVPSTTITTEQREADENGAGYFSFYVPYLVTTDTRAAVPERRMNLQAEVAKDEREAAEQDDTEQEATAKRDVIELAWNVDQDHEHTYSGTYRPFQSYQPDYYETYRFPFPIGIPYYRDRSGNWVDTREYLFELRNKAVGVGRELQALNLDIDTRSVTQFQFTDNLFDPAAVVLIRGRKYVCQKLEITLDERGLQSIKRGYFYELGT